METPSIQGFKQQFEIFSAIQNSSIQHIIDHSKQKELKRKEILFEPGNEAKGMYFVWDGKIKISKLSDEGKEVTKRIILSGDIVGELCILNENKRLNYATAVHQNAELLFISRENIEAILKQDAQLLFVITQLIGQKLTRIEERLEAITFQDARTRIVEFIRLLAQDYGQVVGKEIVIRTKLTHADIAKLTATSRQTVTTILNELKEENLIYFDRQRILVRSIENL